MGVNASGTQKVDQLGNHVHIGSVVIGTAVTVTTSDRTASGIVLNREYPNAASQSQHASTRTGSASIAGRRTMTGRPDRGPVQLFVTCIVDVFYPAVGRAVVRILEEQGFAVEFPQDQTCCGQPAFNTGHRTEAASMAEHTIRVLDATEGPIVVPSGSCAAMIVEHYEDLFAGDGDLRAAGYRVASRVHEFTQFLVDEIGLHGIESPMTGATTFHPSCHGLRHLGIRGYGEAVLDEAGIERRELNGATECCGFGGLFALEMPEVSTSIMDAKLDNIVATGAETLVGYDMSCLMHLSGGARRRGSGIRIRHIAEVIAGEDIE